MPAPDSGNPTPAPFQKLKPVISPSLARGLLKDVLIAGQTSVPRTSVQWQPPAVETIDPLFQKYDVIRAVARGGMGAVYQAVADDGEIVAIKVLPLELSQQDRFADRFQLEAKTLASLSHENIVSLRETGKTSEGHHYFVMEFVDGGSLKDLIVQVKQALAEGKPSPLPLSRILDIEIQICSALQYAHEMGVLHRDIKPSNILLTPEGRVRVVEFGLTKPILHDLEQSQLTDSSQVLGTYDYMPDDVRKGARPDLHLDLFAAGMILYEMFTACLPGPNYPKLAQTHPFGKILDRIIERALDTKSSKKMGSAREFKEMLLSLKARVAAERRTKMLKITATAGLLVTGAALAAMSKPSPMNTSPASSPGVAPHPAWTPPLYYEGFDADPAIGSIVGFHGFLPSNARGAKNSSIVPGSLDYTDSAGNRLITSGNAALIDARQSPGIVSNVTPIDLKSVKGSTLWVSFVGKQIEGVNTRFINFSLRGPKKTLDLPGSSGNDDEIMIIGKQSTVDHDCWEIWDRGSSMTTMEFSSSKIPATEKCFLLGRMEVNVDGGDRERFTLWVNPRLDISPAEIAGFQFTSKVSNVKTISQIDRVRIGAGAAMDGQNPAAWIVDEIRIDSTRESVCPFAPAVKK